jgi:mannitol/fructose-specific phosphotransferase system IIA component (Ntr-type)
VACGLFIFWFYGRIKSERDYALLHLIERLTAKEIGTHNLEDELKTIIRERDEIVTDRFDHLVEACPILDLPHNMTLAEFFKAAAGQLAETLKVDPTVIMEGLVLRETESNTAISPDIAIPHVILEGEDQFELLLVRCREGIHFSEEAPEVHAVFVLAGSRDGRNFHLRCLTSIAQIAQDPHFIKNWLTAKNEEALRDLILLGRRKR